MPKDGFALMHIILAAGGSTRMGRPKALLGVGDGRPAIVAWVDRLAPHGPVTVVTGAVHAPIAELVGGRARLVHNERWAETGPLESLVLALEPGWDRCLVTPVDAPLPSPEAIAALVDAAAPAALGHDGRPGHPVVLDAPTLERIRTLSDFEGGLRRHLPPLAVIEAGPRTLLNLNTPAAWAAAYGSTS